MKKRKTKPTIKYKYRTRTIKPAGPTTKEVVSETKQEISQLQAQKQKVKGGVRGFLQKAAINKRINEKARTLSTIRQTETTRRQTELTKAQAELQKSRAELQETRKKVDFTGILPETKKKQINLADLY